MIDKKTIAAAGRKALAQVTSGADEWCKFLKASAKLYKYQFREQLYIYAQNPQAQELELMESWNRRGRIIPKDSPSIIIPRLEKGELQLEYLFDVGVTVGTQEVTKPWTLTTDAESEVNQELSGYLKMRGIEISAENKCIKTIEQSVYVNLNNILPDAFMDFTVQLTDSFFEDLPVEAQRKYFSEFTTFSSLYTVFSRAGIDASLYIDEDKFKEIHQFNTAATLNCMGRVAAQSAQEIINMIEKGVIKYENKIDKIQPEQYDKITEEERGQYDREGFENNRQWNRVPQRGRVSGTRNRDAGAATGVDREVRRDEREVSSGTSGRNIRRDGDGGHTQGTPNENQRGVPGESSRVDSANSRNGRSDRGTESNRSTEMGWTDEQRTELSGGNRTQRDDLHLETEKAPSAVADGALIFSELSSVGISREEFDAILRLGNSTSDSYLRVGADYMRSKSHDEHVEFLKNEFETGSFGVAFGSKKISVMFSDEGLKLNQGATAKNGILIAWRDISVSLRNLYDAGELLTDEELSQANELQITDLSKSIWLKYRDSIGTPDEWESNGSGAPEVAEHIASLLKDPQERIKLLDKFTADFSKIVKNGNPYAKRYSPQAVLSGIEDMQKAINYPKKSHDINLRVSGQFISDDDLKLIFLGDSLDNRLNILSAYLRQEEKLPDFFKNRYGTGGRGYTGYSLEYSSKGISLKKYGHAGEAVATMNWQKAAILVEKLIQSSEYLSNLDLSTIPDYEKRQLAQSLQSKTSYSAIEAHLQDLLLLPIYTGPPWLREDFYNKAILAMLDTTEETTNLINALENFQYTGVISAEQVVTAKTEAISELKAYLDGTFTLFPDRNREAVLESFQMSLFDSVEQQIQRVKEKEKTFSFVLPKVKKTESQKLESQKSKPPKSDITSHVTTDTVRTPKGKKARFEENMLALETLKNLEAESRSATTDEQEILSRYVGWGGIGEAFDERNEKWTEENKRLTSLLSPEEYDAARSSVLNAHYTPPFVIQSIYNGLSELGFKNGRILEPSLGTGAFLGMLPKKMEGSEIFGVELDPLSGQIAKKLYPDADIQITGFEETHFPDNFFDIAFGNVPFGNYSVNDRDYNKLGLMVHDYFLVKSLDKVKTGGIVAMITSSGTMDKKTAKSREELAYRGDLIGAIRLPNDTFLKNAGTEVTTDILFLRKREELAKELPSWVNLADNSEGIPMNQYFIEHPEMILGKMEMVSGRFGTTSTCQPTHGGDYSILSQQLNAAVSGLWSEKRLFAQPDVVSPDYVSPQIDTADIPRFSYYLDNDVLFFKGSFIASQAETSAKDESRIRDLIPLRDTLRYVMKLQLNGAQTETIERTQLELERLYDVFVKRHGHLNDSVIAKAFGQDNSYHLLCSLEKLDKDSNIVGKADIFHKITIRPHQIPDHAENSVEALAICLNEKGKVDLDYMGNLLGVSHEQLMRELKGSVYLDPESGQYLTADEYLSGNVREKLEVAKSRAKEEPEFSYHVEALEKVQPIPLTAAEIDARMGATWIAPNYYHDFIMDYLNINRHYKDDVQVNKTELLNEWNVRIIDYGLRNSSVATTAKGTKRKNAFSIFADTLNLRNVQVFDMVVEDGKEKRVLNAKETAIASEKQDLMKEAFKEWIFKEPHRREELCAVYNEKFNSSRTRTFDGSHLIFPGMNAEITLNEHQKNAVARALYGGNTLLGHVVGAGKTYTMVTIAKEAKRLGISHKSMFVVPNHLTEQIGGDFRELYPDSKLLVATKDDFSPARRKQFCSRISTGEYDAVIIGHSQFERIPMSRERQLEAMREQRDAITEAIDDEAMNNDSKITIKQLENMKKKLMTRMEKLNNNENKDDVVTFEELGIDRLFVDEAHYYKNLFLYTKMRNVAGIGQTDAQKSSDMFMKCRYLSEITENKGVCFATGTPVSNSMVELYTMKRYLMFDELERSGLAHFDSWASTFGETTTAIELAPEGSGYRMKTRFAKFFNLPELMNLFSHVADIKTADVLDLEVPKANHHDVVLKPSEIQKEMVQQLAERAKKVRDKLVEPREDNMLKITTDGRKLALDQRLTNPMLPENDNSKTNACANNVAELWNKYKDTKSAQLVFCDIGTPKAESKTEPVFSVYDDLKKKLIERGVPEDEIAFIHDANSDKKKAVLFEKVRQGDVRVLLGSTSKMGAGTNVQNKLIALHHLDVPWKPSDIEQQEGRIIRQHNENKEVEIFRYITENTFDAYSWQLIENKQKFISQVMTSKSPSRSCDDIDESVLSYAEIKALATGNPLIKEKMDLDIQVSKLKLIRTSYMNGIYDMQDKLAKVMPNQITTIEVRIERLTMAVKTLSQNKNPDFSMKVNGLHFTERVKAGEALIEVCKSFISFEKPTQAAEYMGFTLEVFFDSREKSFATKVKDVPGVETYLSSDPSGCITRISNMIEKIPEILTTAQSSKTRLLDEQAKLKLEVDKPFPREEEFKEKSSRLTKVNILLGKDDALQKTKESGLEL